MKITTEERKLYLEWSSSVHVGVICKQKDQTLPKITALDEMDFSDKNWIKIRLKSKVFLTMYIFHFAVAYINSETIKKLSRFGLNN